ncbi:hypothetical protein [Herbaspirillum rubrisubalbicans]|uniref:hypothetical protein n=1 Tax=Herbaspirillum rubrisubalbicans TaxID=80842 RepID=UPI0015C579A5|nr:hypothetical protein [Herbaspirillum rubrisubalbicans]NQE48180.1 hypothetical protein [Herbaspirillum rubrisubalbicans]
MLSKRQLQWCADHHRQIKIICWTVIWIFVIRYLLLFFIRFYWNDQGPKDYRPAVSMMEKMNCQTEQIKAMFIPSTNQVFPPRWNLSPFKSSNLDRTDARFWMLENYPTTLIGSEILSEAPACLGAYIADMKDYPGPYAILIVDRDSGQTIFRIALLKDYLTR